MAGNERFFSRIQGYFDATYGGRYVAIILKELLLEEPQLANFLFDVDDFSSHLRNNEYEILVDKFCFYDVNHKRRADLAIVSSDDKTKPLGLLEIKYEDHCNPKNKAQIEDGN